IRVIDWRSTGMNLAIGAVAAPVSIFQFDGGHGLHGAPPGFQQPLAVVGMHHIQPSPLVVLFASLSGHRLPSNDLAEDSPVWRRLPDCRGGDRRERPVAFLAYSICKESPLINIGSVELRFDSRQQLAI